MTIDEYGKYYNIFNYIGTIEVIDERWEAVRAVYMM